MSLTGWSLNAQSYKIDYDDDDDHNDDYGYVNIATTWTGKYMPSKPLSEEKTEAMWSHDSMYGAGNIGAKIGDFIQVHCVNASSQEGIFTHRKIAEKLLNTFSGLKMNEINWRNNPLEHTLNSGKPRVKRAKWLPEREVDIVHIYSDISIDVRNPQPIITDFFTAIRDDDGDESSWFLCTEETSKKLKQMGLENIELKKCNING